MIVDLRSDTVTQPTPAMLEAMLSAPLGDDVFSEDPTVKKLEQMLAEMFGFETGLFCPSGTMANQIAIKAHTQPLDEIICDKLSHIYNYETGGWAFHSGVSVRLTSGERGKMTVPQVEELILPDFDWYPNTRLVAIENTVNKGGGSIYSIEEMKLLSDFCKSKNLIFHLDGARIFNALVALDKTPMDTHGFFHSISVCLSKGLGAPVGSVLLGNAAFIKKSRKIRKVMGGGMRQSGILAAACIYALENNIQRLADDHRRAKTIATALEKCSWVKTILPTETNIVIFEVENAADTTTKLAALGIKVSPFSSTMVRMVTHLGISDEMTKYLLSTIPKIH
ncbi:MAG: aminotransferase class I/II-fold pyridoxal phosphate-dependent enzyme [Chitinophagales bacterium]|nr:aminotransferase class I/II-fold pyridoxal phosphate-dependent enzyme [Chitinophagales bacterium]